MSVALVWFRRDLRLADNPALTAALKAHDRVLPIFIHAPDEEAPWRPGAASDWWLDRSLRALDVDLGKRGARLHVSKGESLPELRRLIASTGAEAVYWNRIYEPALIARDTTIKKSLHDDGIDAKSFNASLLFDPWEIATAGDGPYKVFTPFWRNARAKLEPRPPLSSPRRIEMPQVESGADIDALRLKPNIRWDLGFEKTWQPGEAGAMKALRRFRDRAAGDYPDARNIPGDAGTSRLSPHLHFGEISPMQIVWMLHDAARESRSAKLRAGIESFVREIGWREFSH
ncbi:MAG: deoxyribodipyrimidine photo-lyase, partial [Rhodanobacteraceae bacterium]